jgi:hypothetical protein
MSASTTRGERVPPTDAAISIRVNATGDTSPAQRFERNASTILRVRRNRVALVALSFCFILRRVRRDDLPAVLNAINHNPFL